MTGSRISVLGRVAAVTAVAGTVLALSTSAAAGSGDEHHSHAAKQSFVLVQTDPNAAGPIVVATGPIHAKGTDTVVDANHDVFTFPAGSVKVHHVAKKTHQSFDPVNCYGHFTETGKYWVSGKSGAYRHASGHGTYRVEGNFIGCDPNAAPDVFSQVIKASGPLRL